MTISSITLKLWVAACLVALLAAYWKASLPVGISVLVVWIIIWCIGSATISFFNNIDYDVPVPTITIWNKMPKIPTGGELSMSKLKEKQ